MRSDEVTTYEIRPRIDAHGTPFCTEDECPQYDGKRCRAIGFRPDGICEPAVREMAARLRAMPVLSAAPAGTGETAGRERATKQAAHALADALGVCIALTVDGGHSAGCTTIRRHMADFAVSCSAQHTDVEALLAEAVGLLRDARVPGRIAHEGTIAEFEAWHDHRSTILARYDARRAPGEADGEGKDDHVR